MEQTSQLHLQNKADAMLACLEFLKLNIKTETEFGKMANGKRQLSKLVYNLYKFVVIPVNYAFWIFLLYIIFF